MILELVAFFRKRKIIYLEDFEGEIYKTMEIKTSFGKNIAYVNWFLKIGSVILNEDGTVNKSFVVRWKYKD